MVTSLIKTRLFVQMGVGVGAIGRMVVGIAVGRKRFDVGDESGAGNGVGENPPLQAVMTSPTKTTLIKHKQMDTEPG
jgi:hypothetical protein